MFTNQRCSSGHAALNSFACDAVPESAVRKRPTREHVSQFDRAGPVSQPAVRVPASAAWL